MVDCKQSKLRYRADQVYWGKLEKVDSVEGVEKGMEYTVPKIDKDDAKNIDKKVEKNEDCFVSIIECDNMVEEATKIALKKAKKIGVKGPFKVLVLQDLTEVPTDIYHKIPSPATGLLVCLSLYISMCSFMIYTCYIVLSATRYTHIIKIDVVSTFVWLCVFSFFLYICIQLYTLICALYTC